MNVHQKQFTVAELVNAWKTSSLALNTEYQRGQKWTLPQQQRLIDSIFRNYPVPSIYLHEIQAVGLDDTATKRFEIIDGQQRIRSLAAYVADKFRLLDPLRFRRRTWL